MEREQVKVEHVVDLLEKEFGKIARLTKCIAKVGFRDTPKLLAYVISDVFPPEHQPPRFTKAWRFFPADSLIGEARATASNI